MRHSTTERETERERVLTLTLKLMHTLTLTRTRTRTRTRMHCRAHRRLRTNTSDRIKRSSGCYYPCRCCHQLFRTTTAWCSCTLRNARSYTGALRVNLNRNRISEAQRSASEDIIRVSAGVTVTVESKQQTWTKQSLPQRYLCVGCPIKSDQAIRSLGFERTRQSLWLDAVTTPLTRSE